jgi:hypothetical protein
MPIPNSLDRPRHVLPTELTSFIGREQELAEIERQLSTTRLLTLTGAGGVDRQPDWRPIHRNR